MKKNKIKWHDVTWLQLWQFDILFLSVSYKYKVYIA